MRATVAAATDIPRTVFPREPGGGRVRLMVMIGTGGPVETVPYVVLVEELATSAQARQEKLRPVGQTMELDEARAIAERVAWTFRPRHPSMERSRSVYERLDGSWLVNVVGMTTEFHFVVHIVRWHGDRAAK